MKKLNLYIKINKQKFSFNNSFVYTYKVSSSIGTSVKDYLLIISPATSDIKANEEEAPI